LKQEFTVNFIKRWGAVAPHCYLLDVSIAEIIEITPRANPAISTGTETVNAPVTAKAVAPKSPIEPISKFILSMVFDDIPHFFAIHMLTGTMLMAEKASPIVASPLKTKAHAETAIALCKTSCLMSCLSQHLVFCKFSLSLSVVIPAIFLSLFIVF
jgi:hypothetical protein